MSFRALYLAKKALAKVKSAPSNAEKTIWNNKQNALTPGEGVSIENDGNGIRLWTGARYYTKAEIDTIISNL